MDNKTKAIARYTDKLKGENKITKCHTKLDRKILSITEYF
jgi:hypothetical protein